MEVKFYQVYSPEFKAWLKANDDPLFAYGRTTQLASGFVAGIPTVDLINKAWGGATGVTKSLLRDDYEFSQRDARNLWSLMVFQNLLVVRNMYESLASELPKYSQDR